MKQSRIIAVYHNYFMHMPAKQFTSKFLLFSFAFLLVIACDNTNTTSIDTVEEVTPGGTFISNESEEYRSVHPLNLTEMAAHRIVSQVYEGLVKFDQEDLSIIPSLAEKYEISEDAKVFTFYLRDNIYFQENKCFKNGPRKLSAYDFKYCFDQLCTPSHNNQMFWLFQNKVQGAEAYYESILKEAPLEGGVSGVRVIDSLTLEIDLMQPSADFINVIGMPGCWVYPQEAKEYYGDSLNYLAVGTGPFLFHLDSKSGVISMVKNQHYWQKDKQGYNLPYLDSIIVYHITDKNEELKLFRQGKLDLVFDLPLDLLDMVVGNLNEAQGGDNARFKMQVSPAFGIQYFGFLNKSAVFKDARIRKAFNLAMDREMLVNDVLQGDGIPAQNGIVPPWFLGDDYAQKAGMIYDPEKAKALLAEAGFPDGKGFPEITLDISNTQKNGLKVATFLQKMLKQNLNITVKVNQLSRADLLNQSEMGKSDFFDSRWYADYPSPENFLQLLYSKNAPINDNERAYLNTSRYTNPVFDSIFELSFATTNSELKKELYRKADEIVIEDAPIMPLYYLEFTRLLSSRVQNMPQNALEYRDFTRVYLSPQKGN